VPACAPQAAEGILASGGVIYLTDGQTATFLLLPAGLAYEVAEAQSPDYVTTGAGHSGVITENGARAVFVNTCGAETVTISGRKTWDFTNAPPLLVKPPSITVFLLDGAGIVSSAVVRPDASGNWTYSFTVPKYRPDGSEIVYTIIEAPIANYTTVISGYDILNRYTGSADTDPPPYVPSTDVFQPPPWSWTPSTSEVSTTNPGAVNPEPETEGKPASPAPGDQVPGPKTGEDNTLLWTLVLIGLSAAGAAIVTARGADSWRGKETQQAC